MFGCIVAGRQIQTNLQQVDAGKYVFILPEPSKINHLVVFTTDPFETGYGASLYYNTGKQQIQGAPWQFLGILSNDKPSAIFRVKQPQQPGQRASMETDDDYGEVGISIEPLSVLDSLVAEKSLALASPAMETPANDVKLLLQKLAQNAYNYLASFSKPAMIYGTEQVIPIRSLEDWFNSISRKAAVDPNFIFK